MDRLIEISAGTYQAGGHNTPVHAATVERGFLTPPGEITNTQAQAVIDKFRDRPNGIFMRDPANGHHYLFAMGKGLNAREFEPIDENLLPPHLRLGIPLKKFLVNRALRETWGVDFKLVKRILPFEERYRSVPREDVFSNGESALTCVTAWQAQALAQLLSDQEITRGLFGLDGDYRADLLTSEEWGLMALEGTREYMTSTGTLTDTDGKKLCAFKLDRIARATDYPPLPNGILPNTVWNWTKSRIKRDRLQIFRGSPWIGPEPEPTACRGYGIPEGMANTLMGLRVAFVRR